MKNNDKFEYQEYFRYPTCVCLNLTDNCNLACKYCFVQQRPHYMSLETAKDALNYLVANFNKKKELEPFRKDKNISVTFFGGEPMLLWDEIIVPLVEYAELTFPNLFTFSMTTNGTLLNDERIDFLKLHDIPILLSMDGDEKVQNFNRPQRNGEGSFNLVKKNIPKILSAFKGTTFRSTIYQYSCGELYNTYKFAEEMGFSNIFMCPNAREKWSEENIEILHKEVHKIMIDFTAACLEGYTPINCADIERAFKQILEHDLQIHNNKRQELEINRAVTRCGIGTTSASIGYDGKIFGCQEQDSRDTNDLFYIGNIYQGIDVKKHTKLLELYHKKSILISEDSNLCNKCLSRNICTDKICPSVSYDMFHSFSTRPQIDCLYDNWFLEDAIIIMDFLVKENNETFKNYLDRLYTNFIKKGR